MRINKPLKITGDLRLCNTFIPRLLRYIDQKDGVIMGRAKNFHTVKFSTIENGNEAEYMASAYETKTLIVMN